MFLGFFVQNQKPLQIVLKEQNDYADDGFVKRN